MYFFTSHPASGYYLRAVTIQGAASIQINTVIMGDISLMYHGVR